MRESSHCPLQASQIPGVMPRIPDGPDEIPTGIGVPRSGIASGASREGTECFGDLA